MKGFSSMSDFKYRSKTRTGSAALMLVLALALLVGTFATSVTRRVLSERQSEMHRRSIAVLQSAIDAVADSDFSLDTSIRLPLDDALERWVLVEPVVGPDDEPQFLATLYRDDQPGLSIRRFARSDR